MNSNIKPFLKWAGGKSQLLKDIVSRLPPDIASVKKYVEPFVGAGSVFLYFLENDFFEEYIINDINSKLINLYTVVRDAPKELVWNMDTIKEKYLNSSVESQQKMFYSVRDKFNSDNCDAITQAAYFIFLNKTCFNGLYRENLKGKFNVPFGKHRNPRLFDEAGLMEISNLLNLKTTSGKNKVKILNINFAETEKHIDNSTFVYCDPPYRPVTLKGFTAYSKNSFDDNAQVQLRDFCIKASNKAAKIMISNSDPRTLDKKDTFFDDLYSAFNVKRVQASRSINSSGIGRGKVNELLITNYN